jgi:hypothetical protein
MRKENYNFFPERKEREESAFVQSLTLQALTAQKSIPHSSHRAAKERSEDRDQKK